MDAAGSSNDIPLTLGALRVRGELRGPGITNPNALTLEAPAGELLPIPALAVAGNYVVDDLRLEDAGGTRIVAADPSVATIKVVERVIVSSVRSRPLSLEEIGQRGVVIDPTKFTAYEFTFGIGTKSEQVPIRFPVVVGSDEKIIEGFQGPPLFDPTLPTLDVPTFDVQGLVLKRPPDVFPDLQLPPIPGVIVVPGNIAFLNSFFQVLFLVSNVTPEGSRLVVTSATATLELPLGNDGVPETSDDPLGPAATRDHPAGWLDAAVLNPHPRPGPFPVGNAGGAEIPPQEDGQAEFLVEGKKEGTHRIRVKVEAQLLGLPVGPVPLSGEALGTVVVRNPRFALTFNHPNVVRAGETYSLFVTIHNTGGADANLVTLGLDPNEISGATLVGDSDEASPLGTVVVPAIRKMDTATVEYRLIARKNGQVTATGFTSDDPLGASFVLRTGVGDRGIPLSPESLVLPEYVQELPPGFFETALRVLGLAHSVATAPIGAPIGISERISISRVALRGGELAEAGLRIRIGEPPLTSIGDFLLDWLGNGEAYAGSAAVPGFDPGFDEVIRTTGAGHDLEAAFGAEIEASLNGKTLLEYQRELGEAEKYRTEFLSVAASGGGRLRITDGENRTTAGCAGTDAADCPAGGIEREVPSTMLAGADGGELALVGRTNDALFYDIDVTGAGNVGVGVVLPGSGGSLRQFMFNAIPVSAGERLTARITPGDDSVLLVYAGGAQGTVGDTRSSDGGLRVRHYHRPAGGRSATAPGRR